MKQLNVTTVLHSQVWSKSCRGKKTICAGQTIPNGFKTHNTTQSKDLLYQSRYEEDGEERGIDGVGKEIAGACEDVDW